MSDLDEFCSHVSAANLRPASHMRRMPHQDSIDVHGRKVNTAQPDVLAKPAIKWKNATFHLRKLTRPTANDRKTEDFPRSFTMQ